MLKPLLPIPFGAFPIYRVMLVLAFFAGLLTFFHYLKRARFSPYMRRRVRKSFFWGTAFGVMGGIVVNWFLYENLLSRSLYHRLTQGPYSIFFGLIFFFAASAILLRLQKVDVKYGLNMIVPAVLMTQFVARLGCSLTGCCWGKEITLFGVSFPFPVRELEAIFALVMFFVLSKRAFFKRFNIYVFSYSLFRLCGEFLRADNRGSLFGITAVSPTAMVAGVLVLIFGTALFARPIFRAFGAEARLDRIKAFFKPKPKPGKTPYSPYPFDYVGRPQKHIVRWVVSGVALLTAACIFIVYLNPFNAAWCDDVRYALDDTFGFLFEESSTENEIGDTAGTTLTDLSDTAAIKDMKDALSAAKGKDAWAKLDLGAGVSEELPNGNRLYAFRQLVDGLPVLGKTRVVVTDCRNNALYLAGDAAEFSYTNQKLTKIPSTGKTLEDVFGAKLSIKSRTEGWYDSGEGLVPATHVVINDASGEPALGAVVQKEDNCIISLTPGESESVNTDEGSSVLDGAENALETLEEKTPEQIEEHLEQMEEQLEEKEPSPVERDRTFVEQAILEALENTELDLNQYRNALRSSVIISRRVPGLNQQLFGEILAEEVEATVLNQSADAEMAADCREEVADAFEDYDLEPTVDEAATEIVAQPRQSGFRYKLNSNADSDVFTLIGQPNHTTELTVSTGGPVTVQVCGADGRAVVDMYVDESETISLYPEDGESFVVKVRGQGNAVAPVSGETYRVSVKAIPEEDHIPREITTILNRTVDYYDRSNLTSFLGMIALEEAGVMMEEAIALGVLSSVTDSCAGCVGMDTGVDTAKTAIAMLMIPEEGQTDELQFLEGSELSLDYFHHIETETGIYLKARLVLELDGLELYNGYTFMELISGEHLESVALPETGNAEVDQALGAMLDTAADLSYYIRDLNTDELYAAFGDTRGNVSDTKDVQSLYDLWESYEEKNGESSLWLKSFDEEEALKYHTAEKVHAFKVYTARYNLMEAKMMRATLIAQQAVYDCIYGVGEPVKDIYDMVSDPGMFLLDKTIGANENTETGWKIIKGFVDLDGVITDELFSMIFDSAKSESERLGKLIAVYDLFVQILEDHYLRSIET